MERALSDPVILICDDQEDRRAHWKHDLEQLEETGSGWEIQLLGEDFGRELDVLRDRELAAREVGDGKATREDVRIHGRDPARPCKFDHTAVLLVDYDLLCFESNGWLTGENVAYLARCYSTCQAIVSVNLTAQANPFDLTLVDHLDSFADVNIGEAQLTARALWGGPRHGLSPWSWPSLPALVEAHRERVAQVADGGGKLLDLLALRDLSLPRQVRQLIEADGENDPTFERFVQRSELGLRGVDRPWDDTIGQVGAARAAKWLETVVLPAQDLLADAPHLAQRNPLLLAGDHRDQEVWDRTTQRDDSTGGLTSDLERHRHRAPDWANRPLWRWADVNGDNRLPGVAAPWDRPEPPLLFCEDVSRFLPAECARQFVVDDVPTSLPTRYVAKPDDPHVTEIVGEGLTSVQYGPRTRLTL